MIKIEVRQKISGCFRTEQGADIFMNIHSMVEAAKKNGNSKFNAILAVLQQWEQSSCKTLQIAE